MGRIPVLSTTPSVDCGRWPAKAVVGEAVPVRATVFREGHDAVAATAVLVRPDGTEHASARMRLLAPGTDRYEAWVVPDAPGDWTFRVEGWSDPYGTWEHDATIKVAADVDTELMLVEGANLLERAAADPGRDPEDAARLRDAVTALRDADRPPAARLAAGTSPQVQGALQRRPVRELVTAGPAQRLRVERERALVGAWYEFFPRSEGARLDEESGRWVSGTLRTAAQRLPAIAAMGFDVAYLTPIHPIGTTHRKGRNNTLVALEGDPGSPYAIGSADGGHDAIHPELGTFEDFDAFVARARELGLEVALDLALQCSPDHPWVREHPEWFVVRADGTIAYAENPPKKYQDIYPLSFDRDPQGLYAEVLRVVLLWVEHGVTLFRVDNPHTKPVEFWEWLIARVRDQHPDVLFLSEAFTKPAMMSALAKVGFAQSYTYYTWRETRQELTEYLTELTHGADEIGPDGRPGTADHLRPSFWPTTHDILTPSMQYGGPAAFALRAVIAATAVPTYGIYSGYELVENVARPGAQEQVDNEKYEFKPRPFEAAVAQGRSLAPLLTLLNEARRAHPALQRLRGLVFHRADDDSFLVYSRRVPAEHCPTGVQDVVLVAVNLDPHSYRGTTVHLDMPALGLQWSDAFSARDLLSGETYTWSEHSYVELGPGRSAHVIHVVPPARQAAAPTAQRS
ncbi:alpha-1,4-glucan--maltose-1-phosphate maltosyltransferase [Quadrisphaera sp. DSM 44207]|uniref:alpha-1,4-glucan--maltose-1-phosphate maltosyltransferase n=1 Tax=Quadrisphaera sp. DSM 44207 TaxID=1881057 RepID=UPI001C40B7F0